MYKKLIDLDLMINIEIGQKYTQFETDAIYAKTFLIFSFA